MGKKVTAPGEIRVIQIPVAALKPNRFNQRKISMLIGFDKFVESIQQYGVQEPLKVRPVCGPGMLAGGTHEIVFGERRWRAAKEAGLRFVVGCRLAFADGSPDVLVWPSDRAVHGGGDGRRRAVRPDGGGEPSPERPAPV